MGYGSTNAKREIYIVHTVFLDMNLFLQCLVHNINMVKKQEHVPVATLGAVGGRKNNPDQKEKSFPCVIPGKSINFRSFGVRRGVEGRKWLTHKEALCCSLFPTTRGLLNIRTFFVRWTTDLVLRHFNTTARGTS